MISVIVPIYNIERYLPYCLDSIIGQTYKDIEIILIDDGSTDKSPMICDKYANKDKRFRGIHQVNEGVSAARNKGLEIAKGDFISFIDGDDCIHPIMLETLFNCFTQNTCDVAMVKAIVSNIMYNYPDIYPSKSKLLTQEEIIRGLFSESTEDWQFITILNKLYPRKLINRYLFSGEFGEDLLFNSQVFLQTTTLAFVESELYYYVQRSDSLLHTSVKRFYFVNDIHTFFKVYTIIPESKSQCRAYCLHKTYKRLLSANYYAKKTPYFDEVRRLSKEIYSKTLLFYKSTPYIPYKNKMIVLLLLKVPLLYSFFRWIREKQIRLIKSING